MYQLALFNLIVFLGQAQLIAKILKFQDANFTEEDEGPLVPAVEDHEGRVRDSLQNILNKPAQFERQFEPKNFLLTDVYHFLSMLEDQFNIDSEKMFRSLQSFMEQNHNELHFQEDASELMNSYIEQYEQIHLTRLDQLQWKLSFIEKMLKEDIAPQKEAIQSIIFEKEKDIIKNKKEIEKSSQQHKDNIKELDKKCEELLNIVNKLRRAIENANNEQLIYVALEIVESQIAVGLFKNTKKFPFISQLKASIDDILTKKNAKQNDLKTQNTLALMLSYSTELLFNYFDQRTENNMASSNHLSFFQKDIETQEKAKLLYEEIYKFYLHEEQFLTEELEKLEKEIQEAKKIVNWMANVNRGIKQNYSKVKFYLKDDKKNFFQLSKNPRRSSS